MQAEQVVQTQALFVEAQAKARAEAKVQMGEAQKDEQVAEGRADKLAAQLQVAQMQLQAQESAGGR